MILVVYSSKCKEAFRNGFHESSTILSVITTFVVNGSMCKEGFIFGCYKNSILFIVVNLTTFNASLLLFESKIMLINYAT